ncbi:MAG: class B sortase [Clostridia bacterium]|nr:class B sortase [Clostridia bacterium]
MDRNSFDEPAKVIKRTDAPQQTVYALTFSEAISNFFKTRFSKENLKRFIKDNFPQKDDSLREKIRKTVMDVSFVLLVLGISYIIFYYHGYRERISVLGNWQTSIESINEDELFDFEIKKLWENVKERYPDVEFPEGMALKFADLYAVNQDTAGILSISEKKLWFPVLLNKSSRSYYMWKDLYGEYNRYGNPFIDYRCSIEKGNLSKNTIIYGHNTHDKLGFNKLIEYMNLDGYKEAPVVTLETLYEKTQWKIFAVILTNSTYEADRGHLFTYLITDFSSTNEFMTTIDGIYERSMINTGIDVKEDDKILTLYTCYQDIFDGGRLVVFARLLRDGESAEVDVSKASFNHSARYPQAYYDKLGLTNPYEHLTEPNTFETAENDSDSAEATDSPFVDAPEDVPSENEGVPEENTAAENLPQEEITESDGGASPEQNQPPSEENPPVEPVVPEAPVVPEPVLDDIVAPEVPAE